jgi:hypothetical protein
VRDLSGLLLGCRFEPGSYFLAFLATPALRSGLRLSVNRNPTLSLGRMTLKAECIGSSFALTTFPNDIWLIVGDLLYCLRASGDQLVWVLAKLTTGYRRHPKTITKKSKPP